MEQKVNAAAIRLKEKLAGLGKLKYALLLAGVGVCILLVPTQKEEKVQTDLPTVVEERADISTQRQMEEILSQVSGAGRVQVMLTVKHEGSVEYQTDQEKRKDGDREEIRTQTVFGEDNALVTRRTSPEYLGAVIVAQGGDSPRVCLDLVRAMCSLTGLTSDKITVLKMKYQ